MSSEYGHLLVDGGATKTRARWVSPAGTIREVELRGMPIITQPGLETVFAQRISEVVAALGIEPRVETLVLGSNGIHLPDPAVEEICVRTVSRVLGTRRMVVASDVVTSFVGALGTGPGTVIAAGTGVIAMAVDGEGKVRKLDGWGPLFGDRGSAYWLGRTALDHIYRSVDGVIAPDRVDRLKAAWLSRHSTVEAGALHVYSTVSPVATVAGFARDVVELADDDPLAGEITAAAVHALTELALSGSRFAGPGAPVSWCGGLLAGPGGLLGRLTAALRSAAPGLDLRAPAGSALDGAATLAALTEPTLTSASAWLTANGEW